MDRVLNIVHLLGLVFALFSLGCLLNMAAESKCEASIDCRFAIFGISIAMLSVLYSANSALAAIYRKEKSPD